jgi:hypothetical protein
MTTTFHHPFYDRTQSAFVEAAALNAGDELQTPTGTAVVKSKRAYHTTAVTYDLTVDGLHRYYVLAGAVQILVHNDNSVCDIPRLARSAESHHSQLDPIAQEQRDTVVMSTENGPDPVGSGGRDFDPSQRANLGGSELEARLPGQHAEVTVNQRADDPGLTPRALSSYPHAICPACREYLEGEGFSISDDGMSAVRRTFAGEGD